jgi:hypothetical protein
MKITDSHSGELKFFKGRGRSGKKKVDEFQQMLIEQEQLNLLEKQGLIKQDRQPKPKKKPL